MSDGTAVSHKFCDAMALVFYFFHWAMEKRVWCLVQRIFRNRWFLLYGIGCFSLVIHASFRVCSMHFFWEPACLNNVYSIKIAKFNQNTRNTWDHVNLFFEFSASHYISASLEVVNCKDILLVLFTIYACPYFNVHKFLESATYFNKYMAFFPVVKVFILKRPSNNWLEVCNRHRSGTCI